MAGLASGLLGRHVRAGMVVTEHGGGNGCSPGLSVSDFFRAFRLYAGRVHSETTCTASVAATYDWRGDSCGNSIPLWVRRSEPLYTCLQKPRWRHAGEIPSAVAAWLATQREGLAQSKVVNLVQYLLAPYSASSLLLLRYRNVVYQNGGELHFRLLGLSKRSLRARPSLRGCSHCSAQIFFERVEP